MVFLLAISLACYTLFAGWSPPSLPIPLNVIPILVGLSIFARTNLRLNGIPYNWIQWFMVFVTMLVWCLFADSINGTLEVNIKRYASFLFIVSFAILAIVSIHHEDQMRLLIFVVVCAVAFSSLVAILQLSPYREPFLALWRWRYIYYAPKEALPRLEELYMSLLSGRAAGMTPYSLTLAHQILVSIPLALCLLLTERQKKKRAFIALCLVTLILGAFATGARIAIFISLFFTISTFLYTRRLSRIFIRNQHLDLFVVFIFILPIILLLIMSFLGFFKFYGLRLLTPGEIGRFETWKFIAALVSEHPHILLIGIGGGGLAQWEMPAGVFRSAHNQFLGAITEYGFPGLLLLFCFYLQTFHIVLFKVKQRFDDQYKQWKEKFVLYQYYCTASLLAYIISSLFHDQGPLTADVFHLMILSIFVTLPKCYKYQYMTIYEKSKNPNFYTYMTSFKV